MIRWIAILALTGWVIGSPAAWADFGEGWDAFQRGDHKRAVREFREAAEQGDAAAQFYLGEMYFRGKGIPQDYAEAVKWYREAAEQGDLRAQHRLGWMYLEGDNVPQDYAEAAKWWRKSAEQGDAEAQTNLGVLYARGSGVAQDYAEAAKWWRKAAEQGNAFALQALNNLLLMYKNGHGVDYAEAMKWARKFAEQGYASAQVRLGEMYAEGLVGVPRNFTLAHMWYNIAAASKFEGAKEARDNVADLMTPEQIAEAQKLARECVARDYKDC